MADSHSSDTPPAAVHTLRQGLARIRYAYNAVFYPDVPEDAPPQKKWEASVEGPMLLASVVFLVLFTGAALGKTDARGTQIAELGMWLTWLVFGIDYCVRLALAKPRLKWFFTHLHELIVVLLPWFRPLRVLRVVPVLFLMQRFSTKSQQVTVAIYTAIGSTLMILVAALTIYDAEYGQPGSQIKSFGDALWWSIVTVTTVGYGDITPVTSFGRGVGVVLMIGGIAVAGIVTATVAAWLVQQVSDDEANEVQGKLLLDEVQTLRQELHHLRRELAQSTAPATGSANGAATYPPYAAGDTAGLSSPTGFAEESRNEALPRIGTPSAGSNPAPDAGCAEQNTTEPGQHQCPPKIDHPANPGISADSLPPAHTGGVPHAPEAVQQYTLTEGLKLVGRHMSSSLKRYLDEAGTLVPPHTPTPSDHHRNDPASPSHWWQRRRRRSGISQPDSVTPPATDTPPTSHRPPSPATPTTTNQVAKPTPPASNRQDSPESSAVADSPSISDNEQPTPAVHRRRLQREGFTTPQASSPSPSVNQIPSDPTRRSASPNHPSPAVDEHSTPPTSPHSTRPASPHPAAPPPPVADTAAFEPPAAAATDPADEDSTTP
ncbi:ion channel [Corynebacterium choanae]|nr:potassium channel family protein [Corynebacterium choanae]